MRRQPHFSTATIDLPDDGLRVAVVADTHSKPHPRAYELIEAQEPDYILHGGDIGALSVLDDLATIAPLITVRGNIDGTGSDLPDFVTIELQRDGETCSRWLLTHIAVRGPKLKKPVLEMARLQDAQLVVCGHSHVPLALQDRGVAVFNPGSIGPRRFLLPITFGLIDVSPERIGFAHVSCETGAPWTPSAHV